MQEHLHCGFTIRVHAEPWGQDKCFVMTDITLGGLAWGGSRKAPMRGNCAGTEIAELDAAIALVDSWGRRRSESALPQIELPVPPTQAAGTPSQVKEG